MFVCVLGQAEVESHLSLLWLDAVANNINGYIMKQFATFMCSPSAKSVVLKHGGTHPTVHCTDPNVFADLGIPAFGKVSFTETRDSIKIAKVGNVQFYLNIPKTPWFEDKFNPFSAVRLQTASKKDKPTMYLSTVKTVLDFDDNGDIIKDEYDNPEAEAEVAVDSAEVPAEPEPKKRRKAKAKAKPKKSATKSATAATGTEERPTVTVELDLPQLVADGDQKYQFFTVEDQLLTFTVESKPAVQHELQVCSATSKALWDAATPKVPKTVKDKATKDLKHLFA